MAEERPCTHPDHVSPGDRVRLKNSHALAGHGLFVVDKVAADRITVHDARGATHIISFDQIDCVMDPE